MSSARQLRLGAFMRPASIHTGAWRYPGAWPDMNFNFAHTKRAIQALERAKFDAFFMADHMAVLNMLIDALKRSHTVTSFEPFTLLSALSQVTEHIGLVATGSTTFDAPYHIARRFASLDHISGGRAGWNVVTSANTEEALNFELRRSSSTANGIAAPANSTTSFRGLWDSWADEAFLREPRTAFFRSGEAAYAQSQGRAPFGARPAQRRTADTGSAGDRTGRRVRRRPGARGRDGRSGVHRAERSCRRPVVLCRREGPHGKIRPRARPHENPAGLLRRGRQHGFRGARQAAKARQLGRLRQRHRLAVGTSATTLRSSIRMGRCRKKSRKAMPQRADGNARSISPSARTSPCGNSRSGLAVIPASRWSVRPRQSPTRWRNSSATEGSDGFTVMFPYLPGGLDDFVDRVVPELQRRGLFRREYEGATLRENLGLPAEEPVFRELNGRLGLAAVELEKRRQIPRRTGGRVIIPNAPFLAMPSIEPALSRWRECAKINKNAAGLFHALLNGPSGE